MILKPANKCKIIRQCHNIENIFIHDFLHHPILYRAKFCKHHLLRSRKQLNDKMRQLTMQAFIYYLIYYGVRNFRKIMQHIEI